MQGGQPLAVDIHGILNRLMVTGQRQWEAIADDIHAPVDFLVRGQSTGLSWLADSQTARELFCLERAERDFRFHLIANNSIRRILIQIIPLQIGKGLV